MPNNLDASNQVFTRRMDRFECNGSVSSTPLTPPTIPLVNPTQVVSGQHAAIPVHTTHQTFPDRFTTVMVGTHGSNTTQARLPVLSNDVKDAVEPKLEALRSVPSISTAVSQLLANYEQQTNRDVIQGKNTVIRMKSGRYNTSDTTSLGPQFRWPNEGLAAASHLRKPVYDELNLAQWASGQLANILLTADQVLSRSMLVQMAAALKDAISLPWPVVRSAWAISMTDIEEGRLN